MTCTPAEYVVGSDVKQSAATVYGHDEPCRLAFYNIGWIHGSKKHNKDLLAAEISDNVVKKCVDAIGISEVFNLKSESLSAERMEIMAHLLESLNSSAAQPASSAYSSILNTSATQFVWAGRCDGHYIFLWNTTKLHLKKYEYISCNIKEHPWRKCQYLQFQHPSALEALPLHICHNHNPASKRTVLTSDRRSRIFASLWSHVLQNHSADPGSAAQPAAVFGGDFNCNAVQWTVCFKDAMSTQASRRTVQICTSKTIPLHHGDRAIVINAFALHENSGWGKSFSRTAFSDAHDVVFVPLSWAYCMPTSATSPQREKLSFIPVPRGVWATSSSEWPRSTTSAQIEQQSYPDNTSLSSAVQLAQEDPHDLGNSHRRVESHISTITMQLENLSVNSQQGSLSNSEIVDELGRMHVTHGNILAVEDYPDNMSLSSAVQPAPEDLHDLGNSHRLVESHISSISMQLENLSVKAQQGSMSNSEIVDELGRMHVAHGNILAVEDYPDNMSLSSAVQPAPQDPHDLGNAHRRVKTLEPAPSLVLPSIETPLYNALLDKLNSTDDTDLMEQLAELCVFDKLKYQKPFHSAEQPARKSGDPYSLGLRIEHLLSVTQTQRAHHITRLASKGDRRAREAELLIFDADDMRDIMNSWRKQPHTWMDAKSLELLAQTKSDQQYHQDCKRKFNVMLFHLFGNKALVDVLIRFPICSAEQPAPMLKKFEIAWRSFNNSEEAERARETSKKQAEPRLDRLSKQIYVAKQRQARGKWIADWIREDSNNWWRLNRQDQQLWHEHYRGDIDRHIAELKNQQRSSFAGAGQSLATFMSSAAQPDLL